MPSANGYAIEVDGYTLTAAWPAPYFVLSRSEGPDGPDEPILYHAESEEIARGKVARIGGTLLDADFQEVPSV